MTSIVPNSGQLGTEVSIQGARLLGGGSSLESISFGSIEVTIVAEPVTNSAVQVVDVGGGEVGVAVDVVLTADSGAQITEFAGWTQVDAGFIVSTNPDFGQQGTVVAIVGADLLAGGSSIVSVVWRASQPRSVSLATRWWQL